MAANLFTFNSKVTMKISKLFIYVIVVIVGVAIIDVLFRLIFTPFFDNPPINTKAGATYKFVSCKEPADIIILGASRANHHYRSTQIEDSLGVKVFNYGWDGRCILYQYLCLLKGIENGGLKTVILDLSEAQLCKEWVDERISDLYPYYWKNDTVKMMVDEVEKKNMCILMMSSLIQYNSQYLNMVAPVVSTKGYTPLPYTGKPVIFSTNKTKNKTDYYSDIAIKYLYRMSTVCKNRNIKFIVCLSPSLSTSKYSESYLSSLCSNNGIIYINMTHNIVDPLLFSDDSHLNDKGATKFTNNFIKELSLI